MIILHAGFLDERLFVWGEAPADESPAPRRGSTRKKAANGAANGETFPFDAGYKRVAKALGDAPTRLRSSAKGGASARAWLPTRGGQPIASSTLVGELPVSRAAPKTSPWCVEGLFLDAQAAVEVLCAFSGQLGPVTGLMLGRDLAFWTQALRLAGSLVTRQSYLPGVARENGTYHARWEPVWVGDDLSELTQIAEHMPAVARSLTAVDAKQPPSTASVRVLEAFVRTAVDEIVRSRPPESAFLRVSDNGNGAAVAGSSALSIHESWLAALRSRNSEVHGSGEELEQFAEQVRAWRRPIDVAATAPFRLSFRLEEPTNGKPEPQPRRRRGGRNSRPRERRDAVRPGQRRWYVRFLLQGREDPTLLVPTADAWITRGRKAAVLAKLDENVHEALLASMGQAAALSPDVELSLRSRKPSGFSLDARGAHRFLTETAPALEQAGFGVLLPPWWTDAGTKHRLGVQARVQTPDLESSNEDVSLDTVVEFDWEIALGGKTLTRRDLEELARLKEPLVEVRGHWVQAGIDEIHAALEFWKKRKGGSVTAREIVRMALGSADTSAGIRFDGVRATGWMGKLLGRLEDKSKIDDLPAPTGFTGTLRPYQARGFAWLDFLREWNLGACLADDMGLGKTIQALALVQRDREFGEDRPVLLVCPTSVITNWEREAKRFTPKLPVAVHHGAARAKGLEFAALARDHALVITSYSLVHRDVETLACVDWAGVVLDEAQNIKNPDTKQSQALRTLECEYRMALTGTPVENHVGDLWSVMDFLNPGFLGTEAEFKRSFFVPIQAYRDREASERLQRITGPFILRRLKTDKSVIADLPEKLEMKVFCTLTEEQGALYASVVKEAEKTLAESQGIARKGVILATLTKLKQVCNHPAHFLGDGSPVENRSGKLARLTEMLEEVIEAGDRALVFTQYTEMGKILQQHLQDKLSREVLFLHGGVPKAKRDTLVELFQSEFDDAPPIFLLSLKAGGLGLNLTRGNHVFHYDRWWNPAVENQATDRAFRIGQLRNVQVHKFVCAGTLEDRIDQMIERKQSIAEDIVGTGEGWITELSNEELSEIFALRSDAVRD